MIENPIWAFHSYDSYMYHDLRNCLPEIVTAALSPGNSWGGWRVREPDSPFTYVRLILSKRFATVWSDDIEKGDRSLLFALHFFEGIGNESKLHNHRFPFLVKALGIEDAPYPVYSMQFEVRDDSDKLVKKGSTTVGNGDCYSVFKAKNFYHSVKTLRPHLSIVLIDMARDAIREDRMKSELLESGDVAKYLSCFIGVAEREFPETVVTMRQRITDHSTAGSASPSYGPIDDFVGITEGEEDEEELYSFGDQEGYQHPGLCNLD